MIYIKVILNVLFLSTCKCAIMYFKSQYFNRILRKVYTHICVHACARACVRVRVREEESLIFNCFVLLKKEQVSDIL
jgi:hypothetical protein